VAVNVPKEVGDSVEGTIEAVGDTDDLGAMEMGAMDFWAMELGVAVSLDELGAMEPCVAAS
jgi:hypothetical protein